MATDQYCPQSLALSSMHHIRIVDSDEAASKTVIVFNQYLLKTLTISADTTESYTYQSRESICDYLTVLSQKHGYLCLWPSMFCSEIWQTLLELRVETSLDFEIRLYINSYIGYQNRIADFVRGSSSCDKIFFNGQFTYELFKKFGPSSKTINAIIRPVSIPTPSSAYQQKREGIAIITRLSSFKRTIDAIAGLSTIENYRKITLCVFSPSTEAESQIRDLIQEKADESKIVIDWRYNLNSSQVSEVLSKSLLCLIFSTSYEETQGKIIIEAAASGCLPIVNNWNGLPEHIDPEFVVPTSWSVQDGPYVCDSDVRDVVIKLQAKVEVEPQYISRECLRIYNKYLAQCNNTSFVALTCRQESFSYQSILSQYTHSKLCPGVPSLPDCIYTQDPYLYLASRKRYIAANPEPVDLHLSDFTWISNCQYNDRCIYLLNELIDECSAGSLKSYDYNEIIPLLARKKVLENYSLILSLLVRLE